ncbi:hypothetical protein EDC04DRAFT_2765211 [Pisolithus marmoratus]|nr:hypothetical protein EDC04DRAFT_2765211 [Pisolithus marmoratus]
MPPLATLLIHSLLTMLLFSLAWQHVWKQALSLSVKEYKISNMQNTISKAVQAVFHAESGDIDRLCGAVIKVTVENCMSKKLLMEPGVLQGMQHIYRFKGT